MDNSNAEKSRVFYYDYLRIVAIFAVVIIHVSSQNWYVTDVNTISWSAFNFYDSIARWGVPIFLMISGALILKKDIKNSTIYSKYVLRMFCSFLVWTLLYFILSGENIFEQCTNLFWVKDIKGILTIINSNYHLWFIPMIAGIYICVPIIKQIIANETITKYFLVLSFILWICIPQCLNIANDFGGEKIRLIFGVIGIISSKMEIKIVMGYIFYFILGYYLSNKELTKKQRVYIYILGIMGMLFTIYADYGLSIREQKPIGTYYDYSCLNVFLESIAVFVLFKNIKFNKEYKLITLMSKWSFGAYLIHALIIDYLNRFLGINSFVFNSYISVPVVGIIVFTFSYVFSALLNQIPIIKEYFV